MKKYIVKVFTDRTEWRNEEGYLHRKEGPAVEFSDGIKLWYLNGKLHRTNGPAIECPTENNRWYINGKEYSEESWKKKVKNLCVKKILSCDGKIVEIDGKKYQLKEILEK